MRTALLTWDYPPRPSGLSTAAREIAEGLAAAGAEVTVFCLGRRDRETRGPVTIVGCGIPEGSRLARLRLRGGAGHLAAPIAFREAVLADHRLRPFEVVEATNWYSPAVLLTQRPKMAVVTRNSTPAAFSRGPAFSPRDRIDQWTADWLERRQARRSDALISNTCEHARRIAAEYRLDGRDRPHAVIGLSLPPETIRRGHAASYPDSGGGTGPIRLLFVGRPERRKGFDALMEAAALLGGEAEAGLLPAFELRLAGVGAASLPAGLPEAARRHIRPLGSVSDEDLAADYAGAHAVVAPSRYESFGLVYQEALAYGRPVVASNEDASARVFVGGTGAGSMARETTGPALAAAIRAVLTDAGLRLALRARALLAAGRFTRETLGRETLALYGAAVRRFQAR